MRKTSSLFVLLATAAGPTQHGLSQEVIQNEVRASVFGTYNVSLSQQAHPEDIDVKPVTEGAQAIAAATVSEGGCWGTARGRVDGRRLSAGVWVQATPSVNLGSSTVGRSAAEYSETLGFFITPNRAYARVVGRLRGSVSFTNTVRMTGTAKLEITGLSGIDNNFEIPEEILVADWNHFPPARVISAQRVDRTFYVPVSDSFPNFAQILFQPTVYTLRVKLAVEASVTTGNDQQGNPLAASGSASFAAPLENVPPGPREPKIYMQDGKAFVVGIQFLDEHLNVLDPAPGEADVRSSSGSPFPVLGSVLPWLSGGDNFDDNKQDTGIWGNTVGTGSLHEVEFSLEYRAASSGIHSAAWPLKSNRAPLTESWEMQADVHLEPMMLANLNNSYGAGFIVSSGTHTAGVRMERFLNGAATEGRFRGVGTGPLQPQESSAPAPRTDGAVRLSYNALTKVLSYWYDPDGAQAGYAWTLLQKTELGPLGWNLPPGTLLAVTLGGSSNGPSIPAGTVWMDNFNASSWEPVTASLSEVELAGPHVKLTGVAEPDLPLTLQASDNLTDWASISQFTPSRDGFLNFTTPTDRSARFFRLRY